MKTKILNDISSQGLIKNNQKHSFPPGIVRVTAGEGGEVLMVLGNEKTALIDCGMAYCAEQLIQNIKHVFDMELKQKSISRSIDYIFATHSHYDHIGAMAAIKAAWPEAIACASAHAAKVFKRPGAIQMIQNMSNNAAQIYTGNSKVIIDYEKMQIEHVLYEGDEIALGDVFVRIIETPGHTNCSLSFAIEPMHILFLSESTGVVISDDYVASSTLKSFSDTYKSIEKCKKYQAKRMIVPHYGILPETFHERYWKLLEKNLEEKKEFVRVRINNMTEEGILEQFREYFWVKQGDKAQPYAAFAENTKYEVKAAIDVHVKTSNL